jgi:hypothetical protein
MLRSITKYLKPKVGVGLPIMAVLPAGPAIGISPRKLLKSGTMNCETSCRRSRSD